MKICLYEMPGVPLGKHNIKDPRLDQADKLVEADKKTYVQADVVGKDLAHEADAIVASATLVPDLILGDLEFIETRLSRDPEPAEKKLLEKLQALLEREGFIYQAGLDEAERQIIASYTFYTKRPVVSAAPEALDKIPELLLKAYHESGYISFFTVGGKENRAWSIRKGATAWEAAGAIHTDIQKGFIRAEIISFEDLIQAGGETQVKRAGKMRLETKQYVMQDCDITNFRFNK
jgi:hypothetical protein